MRSRIPRALLSGGARGDLDTLRQIASNPHGFILRQGWASLDFREEEHAARLGKRLESLEMEILSVLEATNQLRESPEFELYELTAKGAEMFDEVVSRQTTLLERELTDLTNDADQLSKEIGKLTTQAQPGEE
jgi:hypothetical protein